MSIQKKSKVNRKYKAGTKENLTTIVDEISYVIGRKSLPKNGGRKVLSQSLVNTDVHIASLALIVPKIDIRWQESGARDAFFRIKKRRTNLIRMLFGAAIGGSLIAIVIAIIVVVFIDHWVKWIIFGFILISLFLTAMNVPQHVLSPYITTYDLSISLKFPKECAILDEYIAELLKIRNHL